MGRHNIDKLKETRQNLILVSKDANIISKMTAFVAIDKEAKKQVVERKLVKRCCPVPVNTKFTMTGCVVTYEYNSSPIRSVSGGGKNVQTGLLAPGL